MTTDDLIKVLSSDTRLEMGLWPRLLLGVGFALVVSLAAMVLMFGPRPDLLEVMRTDVAFKTIAPAAVAAAAVALAASLARPGSGVGLRLVLLAIVTGVALLGFLGALHRDGIPGLAEELANPMLGMCLRSVLMLAAVPLAGLLWFLGGGACLRPALTGAVAGFGAGAAGAAIYSMACDQDSVLFVVPIYGLAVLIVAFIGAMAGWSTLRW